MRAWVAANAVVLGLLCLVTIGGGALRVEPAANPSEYQSVDERAYARLARNLARTGTYGAPEMADPVRWPPAAPFVFAAAHELRPRITEGERWDVPSAYIAQWVFSTATIPAVFVLALLLAGPVAGLLAAGAIAFYPPLIGVTGDLLTEPMGALVLTCALIAVVLALRRPARGSAAFAGLMLGVTVLVRVDLLAVPFLLLGLFAVVCARRYGRGIAVRACAWMLAGVLLLTLPWSVYASSVAGKPVPVSSGGASNLFVGTYTPGDGSMFGLKRELADEVRARDPSLRGEPFWRIPQQKVIDTVAARRPDLDRESALRAEALDNVRDHVLGDPVGFAGMSVRKAWRLWGDYTVGTYRNHRELITAYHLLLVAVGFVGLAAGLALLRGPRRVELGAIAIVVGYTTLINIALVSEARHNLPVMPVLVAGGVAGLWLVVAPRVAARRRASRAGRAPAADRPQVPA